MNIQLEIDGHRLGGRLFETRVAYDLFRLLPLEIELQTWGKECYGPISADLGTENPVPSIPPGGIAYTNQGNYLCLFYGQQPAWPVEHVGEVAENEWQLLETLSPTRLRITQRP